MFSCDVDLESKLRNHDALVLEGCPLSDAFLVEKALKLGVFSDFGLKEPAPGSSERRGGPYDRYVHEVFARRQPVNDAHGNVILSTTSADFPLHTDEFGSLRPAEFVFLLCETTDASGGGDSLTAHIEDVLSRLSPPIVEQLWMPIFLSSAGPVSILFGEPGTPRVRFNWVELMRVPAEAKGPTGDAAAAIRAFASAAETVAIRSRLRPGDCLVLNNHRTLHGRLAFSPASGRKLKRIRIHPR